MVSVVVALSLSRRSMANWCCPLQSSFGAGQKVGHYTSIPGREFGGESALGNAQLTAARGRIDKMADGAFLRLHASPVILMFAS